MIFLRSVSVYFFLFAGSLSCIMGCGAVPENKKGASLEWNPHPLAIFTGHKKRVFSLAFSPNGEQLASGGADSTVRIWNVKKASNDVTLKDHRDLVYTLAFSPNGKLLISGSWDKTIRIWDTVNWRTKGSAFSKDNGSVVYLAINPDGKTFACVTCGPSWDIALWTTDPIHQTATFKGHNNIVQSLAFSSDGRLLASVSIDRTVILWDIKTTKPLFICKGHKNFVECVSFSPDGKQFATGDADGVVNIWEVSSGKRVATLSGHSDGVNCVLFSPCGQYIFVGYGEGYPTPGYLMIWSTKTFSKLLKILCHNDGIIRCLSVSPNRKFLATGSEDHTIRLWDYPGLLHRLSKLSPASK